MCKVHLIRLRPRRAVSLYQKTLLAAFGPSRNVKRARTSLCCNVSRRFSYSPRSCASSAMQPLLSRHAAAAAAVAAAASARACATSACARSYIAVCGTHSLSSAKRASKAAISLHASKTSLAQRVCNEIVLLLLRSGSEGGPNHVAENDEGDDAKPMAAQQEAHQARDAPAQRSIAIERMPVAYEPNMCSLERRCASVGRCTTSAPARASMRRLLLHDLCVRGVQARAQLLHLHLEQRVCFCCACARAACARCLDRAPIRGAACEAVWRRTVRRVYCLVLLSLQSISRSFAGSGVW